MTHTEQLVPARPLQANQQAPEVVTAVERSGTVTSGSMTDACRELGAGSAVLETVLCRVFCES
jgi:hypothetical protein